MAASDGFRQLPGSSRRYQVPAGQRPALRRQGVDVSRDGSISRRQLDNIRAREAGWQNVSQMRRIAERPENREAWRNWQRAIIKRGRGGEVDLSAFSPLRRAAIRGRELRAGGRRNALGHPLDQDEPELLAADGPLAMLLPALGIEEDDIRRYVGGGDQIER